MCVIGSLICNQNDKLRHIGNPVFRVQTEIQYSQYSDYVQMSMAVQS